MEITNSESAPRIFVPGTIEGFRDERKAIDAGLKDLGLDPWVFESKPASSQALVESYVDYVRQSERFVWVVEGEPSEATIEEVDFHG